MRYLDEYVLVRLSFLLCIGDMLHEAFKCNGGPSIHLLFPQFLAELKSPFT